MKPGSSLTASTMVDVLLNRAATDGDVLLYHVEGEELTCGELLSDALRLVRVLRRHGLGPGDRCALLLPTGLGFMRVLYAVQCTGAIPVAFNSYLPSSLLLKRLQLIRPALAVGMAPEVRRLREGGGGAPPVLEYEELWEEARNSVPAAIATVGGETPAFLQLTSGTTGEPRAAVITHRNLLASLRSSQGFLGIEREDVLVGWVPLYHDLGILRFVFQPLYFGCPAYLLPPSLSNLRRWLELISAVRGTLTGSPDFGYRAASRLVDPGGLDLGSLRIATNGGEPVRRSTIEEFEARFNVPGVIRPGYGMAEATLGISSLSPGEPLREDSAGNLSCGRPLEGVRVQVRRESGEVAGANEAGELYVQSDAVFAGYFDDPEETAAVKGDGWLRTGDIGKLDSDGHVYVLGRKRALIKRAGVMLAPREIEEAVDALAGVRLSAALGVRRREYSETEDVVVVVEVLLREAKTEEDRRRLRRTVTDAVSEAIGFPPGDVVLVPPHHVPRTQNGKIRYGELKRLYQEERLEPLR